MNRKKPVEYKDIKSRKEFDYLLKNRLINFTPLAYENSDCNTASASEYNSVIRNAENLYLEICEHEGIRPILGVILYLSLFLWLPWIIISHILYWIIPVIFFIDFNTLTYYLPLVLLALVVLFTMNEESSSLKGYKNRLMVGRSGLTDLFLRANREIEVATVVSKRLRDTRNQNSMRQANIQNYTALCNNIIDELQMTVPREFMVNIKNSLAYYLDEDIKTPTLRIWNKNLVNEKLFLEIWRACGKPIEDSGIDYDQDDFGKRGEHWSDIKSSILKQNINPWETFREFKAKMIEDISMINNIRDNHWDLYLAIEEERIIWDQAKKNVAEYGEYESLIRRWANGEKLTALLVEMDLD